MNNVIKAKWVAALRSGEYQQTHRQLKDNNNSFCCLGVLCDLHSKETNDRWSGDFYLGERGMLPKVVTKWAGLGHWHTDQVKIGNKTDDLSEHNDSGATFLEIADAIENQL